MSPSGADGPASGADGAAKTAAGALPPDRSAARALAAAAATRCGAANAGGSSSDRSSPSATPPGPPLCGSNTRAAVAATASGAETAGARVSNLIASPKIEFPLDQHQTIEQELLKTIEQAVAANKAHCHSESPGRKECIEWNHKDGIRIQECCTPCSLYRKG